LPQSTLQDALQALLAEQTGRPSSLDAGRILGPDHDRHLVVHLSDASHQRTRIRTIRHDGHHAQPPRTVDLRRADRMRLFVSRCCAHFTAGVLVWAFRAI